MPAMYTCECEDGRNLTGTAKWTPGELKQMNSLQLAQALTEIKDFSRYYASRFYYPRQNLKKEMESLLEKYETSKSWTITMGIITGLCTFLWVVMAMIPAFRFSKITLFLAILTFVSIIILIPMLFWYMSKHEEYGKRYPRAFTKLEQLEEAMEKEIFGKYADYLITGFLLTPDYHLHEAGLDFMIQALSSRRASNLADAAMLCKKKLGRSPIPRVIVALRAVGSSQRAPKASPAAAAPQTVRKKTITEYEDQEADLESVIQLADYLRIALHGLANKPKAEPSPAQNEFALTQEEQDFVEDFRTLTEEEQKRVRRIIHSLMTGKI